MKKYKNSKIFLAGHNGLVGSAIYNKLKLDGYKKIIVKNRKELDLKNSKKVFNFLKKKKPDFIFLAAAKVGGIHSNNKYKANFIYENLMIQSNIIHSAYMNGIRELIFLGSSCVYPRNCKQPMKEEYLLSGKLEETNDAYAIAKIAGIHMCANYSKSYKLNYKSLMPPNMYGPGDNYNSQNSHFFPALIKKITIAKRKNKKHIVLWGTGNAKRELMFVEDFADALIYFMDKRVKEPFLNIGTGKSYSIQWFAKFLMKKIGVKLKIKYDKKKPDGMPKKCLDISLAKKYGWSPKSNLDKGFDITFKDFQKNN